MISGIFAALALFAVLIAVRFRVERDVARRAVAAERALVASAWERAKDARADRDRTVETCIKDYDERLCVAWRERDEARAERAQLLRQAGALFVPAPAGEPSNEPAPKAPTTVATPPPFAPPATVESPLVPLVNELMRRLQGPDDSPGGRARAALTAWLED